MTETFEKARQEKEEIMQLEKYVYEQQCREEELLQQMHIENYDFERGDQKY